MAMARILPVPTILNILSDSDEYVIDQNVEGSAPRAKKRRLDHLSWEEKLQRKKLKNRVAAQTSRDRKKAKLEQMENAIQQLFTKNETLLAECERLKEANERLQVENAELRQKLQESTTSRKDTPGKMVGSSPKQLESSGSQMLEKKSSVEEDISEYLLLHHNYAKPKPKNITKPSKTSTSTRKFKTIRPKVNVIAKSKVPIENGLSTPVTTKVQLPKYDTVFNSNFNDTSNGIRIIVNDDTPLNEVIVDENALNSSEDCVVLDTSIPLSMDTTNCLTVPLSADGSSSPKSDRGYESLDSPISSDLDLWDPSVSELFPSLFE